MAKIAIVGSGFSGLSAACYLSKAGHEVHVFEKNAEIGGRARQMKTDNGYVFDMGPSWYWMPDVFERFFGDFGHEVSDFYQLKLLNPSFDIVFKDQDVMHVPADYKELCDMFESIEPGSAVKLQKFMDDAKFKYDVGMKKLVYKPGLSLTEFIDKELITGVFKLEVFSSFAKHVRKYFKHPKLLALMDFPVLFLGAMPNDTPAMYSLMNYAGLKLGTWYPEGGFGMIIQGMAKLAKNQGTKIHLNAAVEQILNENKKAKGVLVNGKEQLFDSVIAAADYHHVENSLLKPEDRNYTEKYWDKKNICSFQFNILPWC